MAMAWRDPRGLLLKVSEQVRMTLGIHLPLGQFLAKTETKPSTAELFGDLNSAYSESRSRSERARLEHVIQTLALPIEQSIEQAETAGEAPRVLAYLTNALPYTQSGYTIRSQNVLEAMQHAGAQVFCYTRPGYPLTIGKMLRAPSWEVGGVEYKAILPRKYLKRTDERFQNAVEVLIAEAVAHDVNLLYTTTDYRNAQVVSAAAARLRIPWVYEVRGEQENTWLSRFALELQQKAKSSEFYRRTRSRETLAMQSASKVITLSEISKQRAISRGVSEEAIYVVPNSVSKSIISRSVKTEERGRADCTVTVGTITSLVGYEGVDDLIRALKFLDERFRLLVVGDGDSRLELEALVTQLGLEDRVSFVGRRPKNEIIDWYRKLDVFAMTRKDTDVTRVVTPIKALEAQAVLIPVVASDLPALREVTGGYAVFCTPEDPRSIARAIEEAKGRADLAREARDWVLSRTWEAAANRYQQMFEDLGFVC